MISKTLAQSSGTIGWTYPGLTDLPQIPVTLYRRIRKDPTIGLVRDNIYAAIVGAGYTIDAEDDANPAAVKWVQREMRRHRDAIVERAVFAAVDYGNQGWELQFDTSTGVAAVLLPPKDLLPENTRLQIDGYGNLVNMVQYGALGDVVLPISDHMHMAFRVEGSNWNGEPLIINAIEVFSNWEAVRTVAMLYDTKLAAGSLVIRWPADQPVTINREGVETPTHEVAAEIAERWQTSSVITMSQEAVSDSLQALQAAKPDWSFEVVETGKSKPQYDSRLMYLDRLKVRAMRFPERALLEAESSGSRADSTTAAGFAIANLELLHKLIAGEISRQLINKILLLNFGPEAVDTVWMTAAPIRDEHKLMLAEMVADIIKTRPEVIDIDSVLDELGIPKSEELLLDTPPVAPEE